MNKYVETMIIDNEDFEVQKSNCYWAGRLIGNPQAWEIANEIVEAIEYAQQQVKNNVVLPDVSNQRELLIAFDKYCETVSIKDIKLTSEQFVDKYLSNL